MRIPYPSHCRGLTAPVLHSPRLRLKEWRRARLAVERGDPNALRNLSETSCSGCREHPVPQTSIKLFELREDTFQLDQLEQVTCGVDVQGDRISSTSCSVSIPTTTIRGCSTSVSFLEMCARISVGNPRGEAVSALRWASAQCRQCRLWIFDEQRDQAQCAKRRWWIPAVGRSGQGKPIARGIGPSGIAVVGKDDACSWWSRSDRDWKRPPAETHNQERDRGAVRVRSPGWPKVALFDGVRSMAFRITIWDACNLAVHGRHFRTLTAHRRPFRLAAV